MFTALAATAALGAGASIYAADKQAGAGKGAANALGYAGQQATARLAPYNASGLSANNTLGYLLGTGTRVDENSPEFQAAYRPLLQQYDADLKAKYGWGIDDPRTNQESMQRDLQLIKSSAADQAKAANPSAGSAYGSLLKPFTGADLQNEPGYQFGLSEGNKGIDRAAAAAGRYDSGATLKALTRFGEDYAGTKYNEAYNRDAATKGQTYQFLSGQQGIGVNAAGQQAGLGMNAASGAAGYNTGAADASAAGIVGAANAANSGVGNYLQYQNNQSTLDYLKGLRKGSIGTGWAAPAAGIGAQG